MPQASFEEFTGAECRRLLAEHHLGRLAEVDTADEATRTSWSVVVRGNLTEVTAPGDLPSPGGLTAGTARRAPRHLWWPCSCWPIWPRAGWSWPWAIGSGAVAGWLYTWSC